MRYVQPVVSCGTGKDVAVTDGKDIVAPDCEGVQSLQEFLQ
jgi:hypothetical protein